MVVTLRSPRRGSSTRRLWQCPSEGAVRTDDEGEAVPRVQDRLVELGYWLGTPDGVCGHDTHHAVVALQKAAGIARDGLVGPATRTVLKQGVRPQPRSTDGPVVEVDRARQLLLLVDGGQLRWTFDTSTGREGLTPQPGTSR